MREGQVVAFEYPNGRKHVRPVTLPRELAVGDEFEMFGRRWRVSRIHRPSLKQRDKLPYPVCVPV